MYYELFQPGEIVTAERYSHQLSQLNDIFTFTEHGRRQVTVLDDNARPRVAKWTKITSLELGLEVFS